MFLAQRNSRTSRRLSFLVMAMATLLVVAVASSALAQKAVLVWWDESDPGTRAINEEITRRFERIYPDIDLKYEEWPGFMAKLSAAFAAGTPPDVCPLESRSMGPFILGDTLLRLTPEMMTKEEYKEIFFVPEDDAKNPNIGLDGEIYAIPASFLPSQSGYWINLNLWEEAGLGQFPKSWAQWADANKKMTIRNASGKIVQAGYGGADWDAYEPIVFGTAQMGGEYFNGETKRFNLTSPEAIQAIETYRDFYLLGNGPEVSSDFEAFIKGLMGMFSAETWISGHLKAGNPELEKRITYQPRPLMPNAKLPYTMLALYHLSYGAPKTTKVKDAVFKFLKFRMEPEIMMLKETMFAHTPPRKSLFEWDAYREGGELEYQGWVVDMMRDNPQWILWDWASTAGWWEAVTAVRRDWEKLVAGEFSVEEAAAAMEADGNDVFRQYYP